MFPVDSERCDDLADYPYSGRCIFLLAIGFNVETVSYKNINFQVWDLGGTLRLLSNPPIEMGLSLIVVLRCVLQVNRVSGKLLSKRRANVYKVIAARWREGDRETAQVGLTASPACRPYWRCYYANTQVGLA
jgi:hypothetical protein